MVIKLKVSEEDINFAKKQISEFEKIPKGKYRYSNVEAWRGIVCEILTSNWLNSKFDVQKRAKGLDTSGRYDDYDMIINGKQIEIKSATKFYFKFIMPKQPLVDNKIIDILIGVKYDLVHKVDSIYKMSIKN